MNSEKFDEKEVTVAILREVAAKSKGLSREIKMSVGYNPDTQKSSYSIQQAKELSVPAFLAQHRAFKEGLCLSSHTHYERDDIDPRQTIFFSQSDLDELTMRGMPGKPDEHLGSFFIISPKGLTLVWGSHVSTQLVDEEVDWFAISGDEHEITLGKETNLRLESIDVSKPLFLRAKYPQIQMEIDMVYVPYDLLEAIFNKEAIGLKDILFKDGMKLLLDYFGKSTMEDSLVDVVHKFKSDWRSLVG